MSPSSSIGSPPIPYHMSIHSQLQSPPPDSSNNLALSNHLKFPPHNADLFNQGSQNPNTSHSMYNTMNSNIHLVASEYPSVTSPEHDALNFPSKLNGSFAAAPIRTSSSFNPFPVRSRHATAFSRDTSTGFASSAYPQSPPDIFGTVQNSMSHTSQSHSQQAPASHSFDSMQHSGRPFEYTSGGSQQSSGVSGNGTSQSKQLPYGSIDPYRQGIDSTSALLQTHQVKQQSNVSGTSGILQNAQAPQMSLQQQHQQGIQQQQFQAPYANGVSHSLSQTHHAPMQTQTQYGPSLPTNGSGPGPGAGGQGSAITSAPGTSHANGTAQNSQQQPEEISTIFVVGFPDDMQEREFQNMFTFSAGFEAATLKIPNKEFTSYGAPGAPAGPNTRPSGLSMQYPGASDPYNLVTMNQGGVLIDGGRDGSMTSWPAAMPMQPTDDGHFIQNNMPMQPPRKQIIGFAKFRTRQEALDARDVLQGRRVDIERGSVLKAEMAKKNLHTKRGPGVGPLGLPSGSLMSGTAGAGPSEALTSMTALSGGGSHGEALAQRDRELGALGAMGVGLGGLGQRRERVVDGRDDEDRDRRRVDVTAITFSALGTRGPRERAEEDERERRRKEKEKEAARLRQNSFAFEAFHSVPQQMVRQGANSLLTAENGPTLSSPPTLQIMASQTEGLTGPWGNLRDVSASAALRKMAAPIHVSMGLPPRPPSASALPTSPPQFDAINLPSAPLSASSQNGSRSAPFSPQSNASSLPSHPSLPSRPTPYSPSSEPQPLQSALNQIGQSSASLPTSSASSVSGSQCGIDEELSRSVGILAVATDQGTTSPQLPSPASGASSGIGRNSSDQNPPINTLYVGNLPTSPSPGGYTLNYLEERLRDLFGKRPGYRKLCFRQKSNGPMCFVEFENVEFSTKALNELNGHTLNGLVKGGGIRLSYSKNPLGVRTPNGGSIGSTPQQPQSREQQSSNQPYVGDAFPHGQGDSAETIRGLRRDTLGMTSPTSSYHYTMLPPPPRFFSPPPSSAPFASSLTSSTAFPRANPQGFGLAPGGSISFSPFGISPHSTIPDQPSADSSNDRISLSATNIEASRAG